MKMKIVFTLICLCLMSLQIAYSQTTKDEEIAFKKGELPLKINGYNFTAQLDKNSNSEVLNLTLNELRELKKNKCKITNFKGDTTLLKGKNKRINLTFNVDTLHLSDCIVYTAAPVSIVFFTDGITKSKTSISVKFLQKIALIDINASRIKFNAVEPPYLKSACFSNLLNSPNMSNQPNQTSNQNSVVAPVSSQVNQVIQDSHIKFVPCSLDPSVKQKKSDLQMQLRAANCRQVDEELQVPPPQKAVKRVNNGFTIRFFSSSDAVLAADMKAFIKTQYPNDAIVIENMSSLNLPKRLEIWIK